MAGKGITAIYFGQMNQELYF